MKIALTITDDHSMLLFRKGLILALVGQGHEVCVITAPGDYISHLEKLGARHIPVDLHRFINPLADIRLITQFYQIFRKENFDIVHNFTIKPNTFGTITAYIAGCKRIFNSVTGLGFMFYDPEENSIISKTIKSGIKFLFKISSHLAEKTWFQNPDDVNYFIENRLIKPEKVVLIKSSGVNLNEWKLPDKETIATLKCEAGFDSEDILVIMVTRALHSKGIHEFLYAMEELTEKYPKVKFVLAGSAEEDLDRGVPASFLQEKSSQYPFFWLGHQNNVLKLFAISDIVVHPSYYREGVPRCLLEAMALKKPIVTTDSVGCRETVDDGVNGFLVPIKDGQKVTEKIDYLIQNPELRNKMGNAGFEKVKLEFEESLIVGALLKDLYQFNDEKL
jgi:N,N'-diacetylbacillosaminyl-diphospho-undecaprenol alpha-1,3-N-acetylgalactosaminyltransferase